MFEVQGQSYLDGRASDPKELGWMQGAPPPADKRVTFESDSFLEFPKIRWALSYMRELTATANIWRGREGPSRLDRSERAAEIEAISFLDGTGRTLSLVDALYDTYHPVASGTANEPITYPQMQELIRMLRE